MQARRRPQQLRLGRKSAAGKQCAQILLAFAKNRLFRQLIYRRCNTPNTSQFDRQRRAIDQRMGHAHQAAFGGFGQRRCMAQKQHDGRFAGRLQRPQHPRSHHRARRLGDDDEDLGRRVLGQQGNALQHGRAAHGVIHIAPTGSDGVADAAAHAVNLRAHLLQARARCGHQPDGAAPHRVGKTQRHAANDGGTAVRPHHQQAAPGGLALERRFLCQRHVVAEQKHVKPELDGLERLGRRIGAGH